MACMAVKLLSHLMRVLPELRYQPTLKHLRVAPCSFVLPAQGR